METLLKKAATQITAGFYSKFPTRWVSNLWHKLATYKQANLLDMWDLDAQELNKDILLHNTCIADYSSTHKHQVTLADICKSIPSQRMW